MKDNESSKTVFDKVSQWFDADSYKIFNQVIRSGDIVELRATKCSHWGIAIRIPQAPISPKSKSKPLKPVPDEIMVFHLIHSSQDRGQVGQFTLEEFWKPDYKIRINNTNNGANLYGYTRLIPKPDVLQNAIIAHASTTRKWHACTDFVRWCSEETNHGPNLRSVRSNTSIASTSSNHSNACSIASNVSH